MYEAIFFWYILPAPGKQHFQTEIQRISEPALIYSDIFSISEFKLFYEPDFAFVSTVSCGNEFHNLIMKCMKK